LIGCSLIADTRESAAAALNASNAYKSIIDAINKAWNASMDAVNAANEAQQVCVWVSDIYWTKRRWLVVSPVGIIFNITCCRARNIKSIR